MKIIAERDVFSMKIRNIENSLSVRNAKEEKSTVQLERQVRH